MRKLLVTLDDELSNLLAKYPNQSEIVRESLRLYIGDITTERVTALNAGMRIMIKQLKEIESKVDYIAGK